MLNECVLCSIAQDDEAMLVNSQSAGNDSQPSCLSLKFNWADPHCVPRPTMLHNIRIYNKGIGDAGSTADFRMLWSAIVCLGLGLLLMQAT